MVIKAVIELQPRLGDESLDKESLASLELIQRLKRTPPVDRYPGSMVLRVFKKGAVVCRQGETGHSAFYLPTTDDLLRLRTCQLEALNASDRPDENLVKELSDAIARLGGRKAALGDSSSERDRPRVATAHLLGGSAESPDRGLVHRALSRLAGGPRRKSTRRFIPIDAPTDVDVNTRQAALHEGDVFGEMSCTTLSPRSATIIADCDCRVLEMNRNIFDAIHRDAGYQEWMGEVYARRALETHLLNSEFFRVLNDEQRDRIRASAQLQVAEPGMILVDEGDPSDSVFIIRNGMVQVVKEANVSLKPEQISDWQALCRDLLLGADGPSESPPLAPKKTQEAPLTKTPTGSTTDDILAAAGKKKAAGASAAPKKPAAAKSAADILAAVRGTSPPTSEETTETDQDSHSKKPLSPQDILAAARSKKKDGPAATGAAVTPQPKSDKTKMSVTDILAAATGKSKPTKSAATPEKKVIEKKVAEKDVAEKNVVRTKPAPTAVGKSNADAAKVKVWTMLGKDVRALVRRVASGESPEPQDQAALLTKLLFLMRCREFLSAKELKTDLNSSQVQTAIRSFPRGERGIKNDWSDLEVRLGGWALMQAIYPDSFPKRNVSRGTPLILKYLSRGECFGEIGVIKDLPRSATCIAYDHPPDESGRKPSRVEFVRIPAEVFKKMLAESSQLNADVTRLADQRLDEQQRVKQFALWEAEDSILFTPEYRDAGFVQGQSLLLIDLDHCTRCGDCVQACINTHEDGNTRLFLDGPRFDRFLVPSACRNCLNPACMIGCPVGSIERGDNGQIEIRDWCIGCKLCATQCPYDSIQIHDIGIVTPARSGWRVAADLEPRAQRWQNRRANDEQWIDAPNPITWNLDLQNEIVAHDRNVSDKQDHVRFVPLRVRHTFHISRGQIRNHKQFQLSFSSTPGLSLEFWLNGQPLSITQNAKKKRNDGEIKIPNEMFRIGDNVIAGRIGLSTPVGSADAVNGTALEYNSVLLQLRLDPLTDATLLPIKLSGETETAEIDLVTHRAVVCDLCSSLPGRQPACVEMCPHEAAIRIDARSSFEDLVEQGFQSAINR